MAAAHGEEALTMALRRVIRYFTPAAFWLIWPLSTAKVLLLVSLGLWEVF